MSISVQQFNKLKAGDKLDYCFEGSFVVKSTSKDTDGKVHVVVQHPDGRDSLTLDQDDRSEIDNVIAA